MLKYGCVVSGCLFAGMLHASAAPNLNAEIQQFMQANHVTAVSVQGYAAGKAFSDNVGASQKNIFELGQLSSLFTAVNLAELVQAGQVKLTDLLPPNSIAFNLPELTKFSYGNLATYVPLTHTAAPIGSLWQESDVNYGVLGSALEAITHHSLDQTYRTTILAPLKMNLIGLQVPQAFLSQRVQGHNAADQTVPASGLGRYPAATGIKASGSDMQHFLMAALGLPGAPAPLASALRLTETPFVQVGSWQQGLAWRINAPVDLSAKQPLPAQVLPVAKQTFNDTAVIDKVGSTAGFSAYIAVVPAQKNGVVILVNKHLPDAVMTQFGRQILQN